MPRKVQLIMVTICMRIFITFNQPLYSKAREIISASPERSELSKIAGGFHLLMPYLGSQLVILKEVVSKEAHSLIYAHNSLDKMLNGHAYARAARAHTLLHLALATIICKEIAVGDNMRDHFKSTILLRMC